LTGQSVLVLQPHMPLMHWLLPVHGPHVAPLVPQDWLEVLVLHAPVASQHPLGHEVGVHFATHEPPVQVCALAHGEQEAPPLPQLASEGVTHCPVLEQQPEGHVEGVQGTLVSLAPSPASVPPSRVPPPSEPPSTGAPSARASCPAASPGPLTTSSPVVESELASTTK
jgi:hypothetical protein